MYHSHRHMRAIGWDSGYGHYAGKQKDAVSTRIGDAGKSLEGSSNSGDAAGKERTEIAVELLYHTLRDLL